MLVLPFNFTVENSFSSHLLTMLVRIVWPRCRRHPGQLRGKCLFLVQSTGVNNNLMDLALLILTMRRSLEYSIANNSITAVLPDYGFGAGAYDTVASAPTAADVARLESVSVDPIMAVDLHCVYSGLRCRATTGTGFRELRRDQ